MLEIIPSIRNKLNNIKHTYSFHEQLLQLDAYTYNGNLGFNNAKFPFMVEKLILTMDNVNKKATKPVIEDIEYFKKAYLASGRILSNRNGNTFNKLFFYSGYDQVKLQQEHNALISLVRLVELYKLSPEVNVYLENKLGLSLEKICVLVWILNVFLFRQKDTKVLYSIEEFKKMALIEDKIDKNDINNFLNFIIIDFKEFKNKYFEVRTNLKTGILLSDKKLQQVDQFIPKISFWYPLILTDDKKNLLLTSYTAFTQFLELDRLYDYIYKCNFPNFKSEIYGHAFNDYVKRFITEHTNANVYGDEVYKPTRKIKYDAPDVIAEFDDYVILIECKSKPFDLLSSLHDFDNYDFKKIEKDYKTSENNINRYFKHVNSFQKKRIYKFVVYLSPESISLNAVVPTPNNVNDLIMIDIKSLEQSFFLTDMSFEDLIKEYIKYVKEHKTSSLSAFIELNHYEKVDSTIMEKKFETICKKYLK